MVCIGFLSRRTHRDRLALPSLPSLLLLPHVAVLQPHLLVGFALLSVRGFARSVSRSVGLFAWSVRRPAAPDQGKRRSDWVLSAYNFVIPPAQARAQRFYELQHCTLLIIPIRVLTRNIARDLPIACRMLHATFFFGRGVVKPSKMPGRLLECSPDHCADKAALFFGVLCSRR